MKNDSNRYFSSDSLLFFYTNSTTIVRIILGLSYNISFTNTIFKRNYYDDATVFIILYETKQNKNLKHEYIKRFNILQYSKMIISVIKITLNKVYDAIDLKHLTFSIEFI